jgi:hypothetical protein
VLSERLVGTFELVNLETRRSDGRVAPVLGTAPIGLFVFDGGGNYSVQLMSAEHAGASGTAAGYVGHWGTYVVDEGARTFTLTPQGGVDRGTIGTTIVRQVTFRDEVAVFNTVPEIVDGIETATYITWRRR